MNILIAPDKFKGSLTAPQAARAIRRGLESVCADVRCREMPIADGGEGTAEILRAGSGGEWVTAPARDALGEAMVAGYARLPDGTTVIDMSAASGLWRVPPERRDLPRASTFGTGLLMAHALERGARKLLLGVGGNATNDGGVGMAAALGWRFLDGDGLPLEPLPVCLPRLARIVRPETRDVFPETVAMCDVSNPLLGPRGATWTYGAQKGGGAQTLPLLETALERLADVAARDLGADLRDVSGAGAAGGLGFGLMNFCGARLRSGFEAVADTMGLADAVAASDLIITGEGSLDAQTLDGKGPAGVAALARRSGKPTVAFAGRVTKADRLCEMFDGGVFTIQEETMPLAVALRDAARLLEARAAAFAMLHLSP